MSERTFIGSSIQRTFDSDSVYPNHPEPSCRVSGLTLRFYTPCSSIFPPLPGNAPKSSEELQYPERVYLHSGYLYVYNFSANEFVPMVSSCHSGVSKEPDRDTESHTLLFLPLESTPPGSYAMAIQSEHETLETMQEGASNNRRIPHQPDRHRSPLLALLSLRRAFFLLIKYLINFTDIAPGCSHFVHGRTLRNYALKIF